MKYSGDDIHIRIPSKIEGMPVRELGKKYPYLQLYHSIIQSILMFGDIFSCSYICASLIKNC